MRRARRTASARLTARIVVIDELGVRQAATVAIFLWDKARRASTPRSLVRSSAVST